MLSALRTYTSLNPPNAVPSLSSIIFNFPFLYCRNYLKETTIMPSANEQNSDRDMDIRSIASQTAPRQQESQFTMPDSMETVPVHSLPQLSQVIEAPEPALSEEQLVILPEATPSGERSLSAPPDAPCSIIPPQDTGQSQAAFVEETSPTPNTSSAEVGTRVDTPLASAGQCMNKVLMLGFILLISSTEPQSRNGSTVMDDQDSMSVPPDDWLPYTLSSQFLGLLAVFTTTLMVTVIMLYWYSATHYGLGRDNGSAVTFFGWRFGPSLFAVLYVQMTAMVLDDVKRTEPFARMARPGGAPGSSTIFQSSGAWWNALFDGISKKKNSGRRSWLLIASSLINVLGFLTISPLSPSLLEPVRIPIAKPTNFTGLSTHSALPLSTGRETYLRILGNILQNVSTSAWITDEYVAFPVWPTHLSGTHLGPSLSSTPQTWQAETIVLSTELDCNEMEIKHMTGLNEVYGLDNWNKTKLNQSAEFHLSLSSGDGCTWNITSNVGYGIKGAGFWGYPYDDKLASINRSSECGDNELIMVRNPWINYTYDKDTDADHVQLNPGFNVLAHICTAHYYMAKMEVTIQSTGSVSNMVFNKTKYHQERTMVPVDTFDVETAQKIALSSDWVRYTPYVQTLYSPTMFRLDLPLAALYDFDIDSMINDRDILVQARRIKQRIFGETIHYSLLQQNTLVQDLVVGRVEILERRIVVGAGVAMTVLVLFQISLVLLIVVWRSSRRSRRILNLRGDPAKTTTLCSLIAHQPSFRRYNLDSNRSPEGDFSGIICENRYYTSSKGLRETSHDIAPPSKRNPV